MLWPELDDILQDVDHPVDGAADPHGQADDAALAVADAGDAVQGALDAGPVVAGEQADALDHEIQVLLADLALAQGCLAVGKAGLRHTPQIHHHFEQLVGAVGLLQSRMNLRRQHVQQNVQIIGNFLLGQSPQIPR